MADILDSIVDKNYQDLDLANICFDHKDLCGADFSNSNLKGSTFKNSYLIDAKFNNADIRGCDFSNANLSNTNFEKAKMGVYEDRFAYLLLGSLGISAFTGLSALDSGTVWSTDESVPVQYISTCMLSTIVTFSASILFLIGLFKFFDDPIKDTVILDGILEMVFFSGFIFSLKTTIKKLIEFSSTSFQKSNLSGAVFDDDLPENVNFSGTTQDVIT